MSKRCITDPGDILDQDAKYYGNLYSSNRIETQIEVKQQ